MFPCLAAAILIPAATGCASRADSRGPAVVTGAALDSQPGFYRAGQVTFGPQLDTASLAAFTADPATTIINLRSNQEMADLIADEGFDEAAQLQAAGVRYIHIPLGGDDGYEPEAVDAFAEAIESADGPVLIHCYSGGRARTMWQAYLVKHRGFSLARAEAVAATLGASSSALERLLDRDIRPTPGGPLPKTP